MLLTEPKPKRTCSPSMFRMTRWSAPQLLAKERRLLGHIAPTVGTSAGGPSKHQVHRIVGPYGSEEEAADLAASSVLKCFETSYCHCHEASRQKVDDCLILP
jgi:hypothetical protein